MDLTTLAIAKKFNSNNSGSSGGSSSGGDIFIVPIYSDEGTAKCDFTYDEIKQAVLDGKAVFGVGDAGTYGSEQYTFILSSVTSYSCVFTTTTLSAPDYTSARMPAVVIKSDNTIERHFFHFAKN